MIWRFPKMVVPPNHRFDRVFHSEPSIFGVPLFLEAPIQTDLIGFQDPNSKNYEKPTDPEKTIQQSSWFHWKRILKTKANFPPWYLMSHCRHEIQFDELKKCPLASYLFRFCVPIFWRLITSTSSMGVYSFHYFRWGETVLIYDTK